MTTFRVGDIPAQPFEVVPFRDDEPVDLTPFTAATVTIDGVALDATIDEDAVLTDWPTPSLFSGEGLYSVTVTLTGPGVQESFSTAPLIVEPVDPFAALSWHTVSSARRLWKTALTDEALYGILAGSKRACLVYLELTEDDPEAHIVSSGWRDAQLMQARNVLNSGTVKPGGGWGNDEYEYGAATFPLDWGVRALLRPVRVPKVR